MQKNRVREGKKTHIKQKPAKRVVSKKQDGQILKTHHGKVQKA